MDKKEVGDQLGDCGTGGPADGRHSSGLDCSGDSEKPENKGKANKHTKCSNFSKRTEPLPVLSQLIQSLIFFLNI